MDKYFEIKSDCALYKAYFAHKEDEPKIVSALKAVCEKFGVETKEFYIKKDRFWIVPTTGDREKFAGMMKKTNDGEFKKNSEVSKMWFGLVKDIEHFEEPELLFYFDLIGHTWKEVLFHSGEKLYCSIESDKEVLTPDFAIEMKASEFYRIIEKEEVGEKGETNE